MTPKQETMREICNIIDSQAKKEGAGLDRQMFSQKAMHYSHEFLSAALANMKSEDANGK